MQSALHTLQHCSVAHVCSVTIRSQCCAARGSARMPSPRWHIIASRYLCETQPHPAMLSTRIHAAHQCNAQRCSTHRCNAQKKPRNDEQCTGAARSDAGWHTAADEAYCASVDPDAAAILNLNEQTNTPTQPTTPRCHAALLHCCHAALLHRYALHRCALHCCTVARCTVARCTVALLRVASLHRCIVACRLGGGGCNVACVACCLVPLTARSALPVQ